MAGEFLPLEKEVAGREKNMWKTDLFYQNKHDHHFFLRIFNQVFEK